jgi:hypothetical protein
VYEDCLPRNRNGRDRYHRDTISSRALALGSQGSAREVSFRHKDVIPTGCGPVGSGRDSAKQGYQAGAPKTPRYFARER